MKAIRLNLSTAAPWRALIETLLLSWLLTAMLVDLAAPLQPSSLGNATRLISAACGVWCAFRWRVPASASPDWNYVFRVFAMGLACGIITGAGTAIVAVALGWNTVLERSSLHFDWTVLAWVSSGIIFWLARSAMHAWWFWDGLRQKRLVWSLTHAHLAVVAFFAVLSTLLLWLFAAAQVSLPDATARPLPMIGNRLLVTLLPALGVFIVFALVTLLILLPASALFSFWFARRTTRRLERLAAATGALRSGHYATRVEISGADEIAQLQTDFNAMAADLERTLGELQAERDRVAALLESRRALVANVSHELRTPVATLRSYVESTLQNSQDNLPPGVQHNLQVMQAETRNLQNLIADLFTLAQLDVKNLTLDCRATDVGAIVRQVIDAQAPLAWQSARVEVVADVVPNLPRAMVDASRMEQVLINLVRNGVRHTPPSGIVMLQVSAEPQQVVVVVRDSGEGIPEQDLPHIWERFYRGQDARSGDAGGAGLGLAIVKEWIEAMNGTVSVESQVGRGSSFTLRLKQV